MCCLIGLDLFHTNNIINQNPDNKQETGVTGTGATENHLKTDAPHLPSTNMGPPIHVGFPNGQAMQSSKPCLLYLSELPYGAC